MTAVRRGLGPLLDAAGQQFLSAADIVSLADQLCVCRAGAFDDGRWLAGLLCGPDGDSDWRQKTIQLILFGCGRREVVDLGSNDAEASLINLLAFGDLTTEATQAGLTIAGQWQGTIFRSFLVWAWRRLWARLIEDLGEGPAPVAGLIETFAGAVPAGITVGQFRADLPANLVNGLPVAAELAVHDRGFSPVLADLAELMVLAGRVKDLTEEANTAYVGEGPARYEEFGPRWLLARLEESAALALPDFAADLARRLITRAQRVAFDKGYLQSDGSLGTNSKFEVVDGIAELHQPESGTPLGLRLSPLTSVLAACGVVHNDRGLWHPSAEWEQRLG